MANRRIEPLSAIYPRRAAGVAIRMLALRMRAVRAFAENCRRGRPTPLHPVDERQAHSPLQLEPRGRTVGGLP